MVANHTAGILQSGGSDGRRAGKRPVETVRQSVSFLLSLRATHQRNKSRRMATGNSSAALLLVTGLLSFSMAAMGFYYLQMSKKTPSDNDTGVKAPAEVTASPEKVIDSPKKVVVETPKQVVNETPKSSPAKSVGSLKEAEPPVLELPKPILATPESPKKTTASTVESPKKNSEPAVVELPKETPIKTPASPKKTVESLKEALESPKQAPESPKKAVESPKKVVEPAPAVEELDAVARKLSEEFIIAQAASETASAFADELLQESLENIALEQEEYVQVELTQSMTLSQSTPELINIEDAVTKDKEVVRVSAATEDEESIVEEEEQEEEQTPAKPIESVEAASDEPLAEEVESAEALASPKSPNAAPASWEAIASSPVVKADSAEETATPLVLDTPAETTESTETLSINVPAENTEASAEDKDASSPVSSGGSSPGKRNRNRSKKAKSKRKKGKKHQKFKA